VPPGRVRRAIVLLSLAGGCAHAPPLRPVLPQEMVANDPLSGSAEVASVRMTVHPDDWKGYPDDLDSYLTPVEVFVENQSGKEIKVNPELFSLVGPNGFRYEPLRPGEVQQFLRSYARWSAYSYSGSFGTYDFPGPDNYPYLWWGGPWPPVHSPPARDLPPLALSGTLASGGHVSVLLFFQPAASSLERVTFEARLLTADGQFLGEVRLPFARHPATARDEVAPSPAQPSPSSAPRVAPPGSPPSQAR